MSWTADTFRPHIGERFRAELDSNSEVGLDLMEVRAATAAADGGHAFMVLFRVTDPSLAPLCQQATYAVSHPCLGQEPALMFLVPGPPDPEGHPRLVGSFSFLPAAGAD